MEKFHRVSFLTACTITKTYSTSFYFATSLLKRETRKAIYGIYGFVRFADEIVDTFHDYNKKQLIDRFEADLKLAIADGISLNPVLHVFQQVIHDYDIPYELIDAFMKSMRLDLEKQQYHSNQETETYIYGSANVVGLMCLKVFTQNDDQLYHKLKQPAMKLGSAFQKVNFLRDLHADAIELNRQYFCNCDVKHFDEPCKQTITTEISEEFKEAYKGIIHLPGRSKLAVFTAYLYYEGLLNKIIQTPSELLVTSRIRISNFSKLIITVKAVILYALNRI